MDGILTDFVSARWWFTVVVMTLFLNYISPRLNGAFDRFVGNFSAKRRKKNEAKKQAFEARVVQLLTDEEKEQDYRFRLISDRLRTIEVLVMGGFFLGLGGFLWKSPPVPMANYLGMLLLALGLLIWTVGMTTANLNADRDDVLREVRKRKLAAEKAVPKLVIRSARYGVGEKFLHVEEKLAALIRDDAINSKCNNANFGPDPAPGQGKCIWIEYSYAGTQSHAEFDEGQEIKLP